jgi:hypothetical protein
LVTFISLLFDLDCATERPTAVEDLVRIFALESADLERKRVTAIELDQAIWPKPILTALTQFVRPITNHKQRNLEANWVH